MTIKKNLGDPKKKESLRRYMELLKIVIEKIEENPTIAVQKVEALFMVDEPTAIEAVEDTGPGDPVPAGGLID